MLRSDHISSVLLFTNLIQIDLNKHACSEEYENVKNDAKIATVQSKREIFRFLVKSLEEIFNVGVSFLS